MRAKCRSVTLVLLNLLVAGLLLLNGCATTEIDRRAAVHRRRRIILNDDNAAMYGETLGKKCDTPEDYLAFRLAPLADSHVDSIWLSTMVSAEILCYDALVGEAAGQPYPGAMRKDEIDSEFQRVCPCIAKRF